MVWKNYFEELKGKLEAAAKEPGTSDSKSWLVSRELHELEHQIYKLKQAYSLTSCNGRYQSKHIAESFLTVDDEPLPWRAIDFQYYLLGEMLLSLEESRPSELMQHKLLFRFLDRLSVENFSYKDIEFTSSGATRCETNAGFALQHLRDVGLVVDKQVFLIEVPHMPQKDLFNRKKEVAYEFFKEGVHPKSKRLKKKTWSLSYFGFWVAMSFLLVPLKARNTPMAFVIRRSSSSNFFFSTDPEIWRRVKALLDNTENIFVDTFSLINKYAEQPVSEQDTLDVITRYYELYIKYRETEGAKKKDFKNEIRQIEKEIRNHELIEQLMSNLRLPALKAAVSDSF